MTQPKHTPGPWRYAAGFFENEPIRWLVKQDVPLSKSWGKPALAEAATESDARLIAAAPDMLEALRELVGEWDAERAEQDSPQTGYFEDTCGIEWARAAIAKATGGE